MPKWPLYVIAAVAVVLMPPAVDLAAGALLEIFGE